MDNAPLEHEKAESQIMDTIDGLPVELSKESLRCDVYNYARKIIQQNNVPEMSIDEINAEIAAARK